MLALTRKLGETVVVTSADGAEFRFTVVELDRGRVRLAFDAPPEIVIDRLEVHLKKQELKDAVRPQDDARETYRNCANCGGPSHLGEPCHFGR